MIKKSTSHKKSNGFRKAVTALLLTLASGAIATEFATTDNQLSSEEQNQGWQLLFDGKSLKHWRNFKQENINPQWQAVNGTLSLNGKGGGDILTKKKYRNYELTLDWKVSLAGNSGIFIMVDELGKHIYSHAPEIQILDNQRHRDNKIASHLSGSLFDLIASPKNAHKEAGEWNNVRIKLNNQHLQVWQNQEKTIDVVIGSDTWQALVKNSKFATWRGFGHTPYGHIGLQDHGDDVAFKNIKIKEL